jgi:vacuolar-type H+-ATPase subunit I/STV1
MCAMAGPEPARPEPGPDAGIDDIQADIEQTRKELGQTVEALQAKLDVKERTKEKAAETKERVVDKADTLRHTATDNTKRTVPVVTIVLLGALAVGIVIWRRRY